MKEHGNFLNVFVQNLISMEPKDRALPLYVEESMSRIPPIHLPKINDAAIAVSGTLLHQHGVIEDPFREHCNYTRSSLVELPISSPSLPSIQALLHRHFQDHRWHHPGPHMNQMGGSPIQYSSSKQRPTTQPLRYHFIHEQPHQSCGDNHMVRFYNHPASASYGETTVTKTRSMYAPFRPLQPQTTMNQSSSAPWPVAGSAKISSILSSNTRVGSATLPTKATEIAPTTTVKNVPHKAAARKGAAKASSSSSSPVKTRLTKVTTTASGTKKVLRIGEGSTKYRCKMDGCSKIAHQGGKCIKHGGGKRCEYPDCSKSAQSRNLCFSHGGGRRCKVENCNRGVQRQGLCCIHQDLSDNNKK